MKIFFTFVFIVLTVSNADYLYVKTNQCVYNLEPFNNKGWCYTKRSNDQKQCNKRTKYTDFINGFFIDEDNGKCMMYDDLQKTGMTYNQFQFQEALLANMYGFFIFFLVGFLFVLQGRR